jgi:acyl transferase domain-containing protein
METKIRSLLNSVTVDFQNLKVRASRAPLTWPQVAIRRASVNSFGFGGSNAHVVLEETKSWAKSTYVSSFRRFDEVDDFFAEDEAVNTTPFILLFSGNDDSSLQAYVKALKRHLMYPGVQVKLPDLAFTLSERRTHHFHRGFVVTNKAAFDSRALISCKKSPLTPRIGFVFTGQGAQWPQMGKLLVEGFPLAGKLLRYLDTVLQQTRMPPAWSLIGNFSPPLLEFLVLTFYR